MHRFARPSSLPVASTTAPMVLTTTGQQKSQAFGQHVVRLIIEVVRFGLAGWLAAPLILLINVRRVTIMLCVYVACANALKCWLVGFTMFDYPHNITLPICGENHRCCGLHISH